MKSTLANVIIFLILVAIILFGILAIQNPQQTRHDWAATQRYVVRQWGGVQHWWARHIASPAKVSATPPAAPTAPATAKVLSPVTVPPPVRTHFPENLTPAQYALLMAARTAFWQHDPNAAIADYRALIRQHLGIPQLYGELGNLYFQTGHHLAAGEAYTHAAECLISHHQYPAAADLLPLIHALDPNQADIIRQELAR